MKTHVCRSTEPSCREAFRVLSDRIHDMWFWIDDLAIDREAASMTLPLSADADSPIEIVLTCQGVEHVTIEDTAQIGQYDINYLSQSRDSRALKVICNMPIGISVRLGETWELSLAESSR